MKRRLIKELLRSAAYGSQVVVAGWVRTRRDSKGGFSFIELNDGSCLANLQIVAPNTLPNYEGEILRLTTGAAVRVTGALAKSQGKGQAVEVQAAAVEVVGPCDPETYPLQKKKMSFELLREVAHLRPRTNTFGAIARLRDALAFATHAFFRERGFLYVHTPIITASDCEGAGQMFQVTTLDLAALAGKGGPVDYGLDFFGKRTGLTVSGQLEAEAYACALGNVYTFGPTFRAENSNTRRHLSEFWMIEPEMAFADLDDDADLAEDYLRHLFSFALEHCGEDIDFFTQRIDPSVRATLERLAASAFKRITYEEAVAILQKASVAFEFPVRWGVDLQSEHERHLTEEVFKGPVIVMHYPKEIKAFYMRLNDDRKTVAAMDVLIPQVGEIIGGSQREDRLEVLEERMRDAGLNPADYAWYGDLRRFGSVPHAGFGLGFERLVQFASGMQNIRDVIPFPRTPRNADF
ncbi:MAG TPA: asparagine--tRNA ligase [Planctomycetota bacterium]|jgi:asparaginyl-tRNA synthetase|nr:asparagine--tRNA ligase [Planctomycetota bacterium]OQC20729.1 MAG: Asparagine--tRNA ligase [Planctomycetes bacterium ADurb.Bin069]HNR98340.1 asparagine--tRNA ligase [Planctomycetota bacterium]HNU24658.1 asparagine--tRNA ligase [Planctomycetota bacterium]HOE28948.1 asparagine--tRNA ligase [Planctomycetota bacterium]